MRNLVLVLLASCICCSGCYASMTGKVVDVESGKPIEGAVLLVEWLKTEGLIGLTYRTTAKAVEVFSDKDGNVTIPGYFNPFAEGPFVTIYKSGYVAWNSQYIFPGYKKRDDFDWKDGYVFKLTHFKEGYSYSDHDGFVNSCIHNSDDNSAKKDFIKIFYKYEKQNIRKELDLKIERQQNVK